MDRKSLSKKLNVSPVALAALSFIIGCLVIWFAKDLMTKSVPSNVVWKSFRGVSIGDPLNRWLDTGDNWRIRNTRLRSLHRNKPHFPDTPMEIYKSGGTAANVPFVEVVGSNTSIKDAKAQRIQFVFDDIPAFGVTRESLINEISSIWGPHHRSDKFLGNDSYYWESVDSTIKATVTFQKKDAGKAQAFIVIEDEEDSSERLRLATEYQRRPDLRQEVESAQDDHIWVDFESNFYSIVIEGNIIPGDYARFVTLVKLAGEEVRTIKIRSAGGNVTEAINIGSLIRRLRFETEVPEFFGPSIGVKCIGPDVKEKTNCTCASACFLIYTAGVHRSGNVLGIHNVYINHDHLKNMSGADAIDSSEKATRLAGAYLDEMGVKKSYTERMSKISSNQIEFLTPDEVETDFKGDIPSLKEWLIAKCGDFDELLKAMRSSSTIEKDTNEQQALEEKMSANALCRSRQKEEMTRAVFKTELSKSLKDLGKDPI